MKIVSGNEERGRLEEGKGKKWEEGRAGPQASAKSQGEKDHQVLTFT